MISLCLDLFPWAKFRRTKGGVKVQVLLDHDDYMPAWVLITDAKTADVKVARSVRLNPGCIVAMDRAYNDYDLFGRWCDKGIYFVTRMKEGTRYEIVESRPLPQNRPILAEEIIILTSLTAQRDCPEFLRGVVVWDSEIVLLTKSSGHRGHDDRRDLQAALADRTLLQGVEAEPQDQDLRGDQ